jgi:5-methyltetrahydrofolate--homocysteine methyltransferase
LSALLVSTSQQMPLVVAELHKRNLALPVLFGGAAVNPEFARRILHPADGGGYAGGCFTAATLSTRSRCWTDDATPRPKRPRAAGFGCGQSGTRQREIHPPDAHRTRAHSPGAIHRRARAARAAHGRIVRFIEPQRASSAISWGVRNAKGEKWEQYQRDFTQRLESMWAESQSSGWLQASAVYGYFPLPGARR